MRIQYRWLAFLWLIILPAMARADVAPATQPATQPAAPDSFMRFVDDGKGGGSLQTAEVTFQNNQGVSIHLIAAIHIAEGTYYKKLNEEFKGYDSVLYELVSPKGTSAPKPGDAETTNPISEFQQFLKSALDLDFQLDDVDYQAPNFVHADMDAETFQQMQEQRGETFEQLMLKQLLNSFNQPPPTGGDDESLPDLINMLTKPDMERQIKVLIARQLGQMDTTAMGLDGPHGSVILTERNKAAFKTLADTLAKGQKNIAIFYGAAHMPDMTKRLADMGFSPTKTDWNVAWDLAIRADQPSAVDKLLDSFAHAMKDPNNGGNGDTNSSSGNGGNSDSGAGK